MTRPISGGILVCRPKTIVIDPEGDCHGLTLMSDLHIGAPQVDYDLIRFELDRARYYEDRVLLNGDLLDLILPGDTKRFTVDCLHPRLRGTRDIVGEAVRWAVEILGPYADLIDMVGMGNHESTVEKKSSLDVTRQIVEGLERCLPKGKSDHKIHYGGYCGYAVYRFRRTGLRDTKYTVFYHHGAGSGTSLARTIKTLEEKSWAGADLYWAGHRHVRGMTDVQELRVPDSGDFPIVRSVRLVSTGGYYDTYGGQPQWHVRKRGRRSNYAADAGMRPMGMGGARVQFHFGFLGRDTVTVSQ